MPKHWSRLHGWPKFWPQDQMKVFCFALEVFILLSKSRSGIILIFVYLYTLLANRLIWRIGQH